MAQYDGQQVAFAQGRYRIERFWGCLPEDRQLGIISTLAVGSDGTLFVAQRNGPPVLVFAPDGQLRDIWPEHTAADPHGISVARTETSGPDRILLVDRDAHQVLLCSTQGEVLLALGERHRPRFQAPFNHPLRPRRPRMVTFTWPTDMAIPSCIASIRVAVYCPPGVARATGPGRLPRPMPSGWTDATACW